MNWPNLHFAPTGHSTQTYLPYALAERSGIGLSLSGGGYRAALFHLGSLRRLNEVGLLARLRTISSVSGGSILSAHLATRISWPLDNCLSDWEERVAAPFRAFTKNNIRTAAILKGLLPGETAVGLLADAYHRNLTSLRLVDLPDRPNFIFCATDLGYGVNWTFQKASVGDYQVGYLGPPPAEFPSILRAL